jgi:hypothetical protein
LRSSRVIQVGPDQSNDKCPCKKKSENTNREEGKANRGRQWHGADHSLKLKRGGEPGLPTQEEKDETLELPGDSGGRVALLTP